MGDQAIVWLVVAIGIILVLALRLNDAIGSARESRAHADIEIQQAHEKAQQATQQAVAPLLVRIAELSGQTEDRARAQFEAWRRDEIESIRRQQMDSAYRETRVLLDKWKVEAEVTIRADAIQRSQAVVTGKVTEHVAPYLPQFTYNPKDARFLGTPVDLVVFDGLDTNDVRQVVFIEVKAGSGSLSMRERQVRDAIARGRVKWEELRVELPALPNGRNEIAQANTFHPSQQSFELELHTKTSGSGSVDVPNQSRLTSHEIPVSTRSSGIVQTRAIRAICTACHQIMSFTVRRDEQPTPCPSCGASQTFHVEWTAASNGV